MRRKELSNDQVRITVRLPAALYDSLMDGRRFRHTGSNYLSHIVRKALEHTLVCPERLREEEEARAAAEAARIAYEQERAARAAERDARAAAETARAADQRQRAERLTAALKGGQRLTGRRAPRIRG